MSKHLYRDMERIHRDILSLSAMVEYMIDKASLALRERREDLADEVVQADNHVDQQEVIIEEECLKVLALHQPVAIDLRRVATVLKLNNDLERIADLAVNIADRARAVIDYPEFKIPKKLDRMVNQSTRMVRLALDAFVRLDSVTAKDVMKMDDEVDMLNVEIIAELQDVMQQNSQLVVPALHCFSATRHIERIGDLATNIAEDVFYLVEGEIVRHKHKQIVSRISN
jgi:phosphate transport system protein